MTYREQLLEFIFNDIPGDAMIEWIKEHPLLEQTDIMRELKKLAQELADQSEEGVNEKLELFDEKINTYEDSILEEKLLTTKLDMILDQQQKATDRVLEEIERMRGYILQSISTNAPDANEMRVLAKDMIEFEKKVGAYNPENWAGGIE